MSIDSLAAQLKDIFGDRLKMVAAFGDSCEHLRRRPEPDDR